MTSEASAVSPRRNTDNSDQKDDEVTLASSPAQEIVKPLIVDDDTTSHDDTTTHERRRHLVKPIILGIPDQAATAGRERIPTLRSVSAPKKRPPWIWPAIAVCLVGGGLAAWRMSTPRARPRPNAVSSATQTASALRSADTPNALKLSLDVHIEPRGARVHLDGKPLEKTEGVELELPCPNGFHDLRVDAKHYQPVSKRIPCEGRVVMDLTLEEQ